MKGCLLLQVALLCALVSCVSCQLCEGVSECVDEEQVLQYDLDGIVRLELFPEANIREGDCLLGNCTHDNVVNMFLEDILPGNPCFLQQNLQERCDGEDVGFGVFALEDDNLIVAFAALFNVLFNSGENCIQDLECIFRAIAILIAENYDVEDIDEIDIRVIEASAPKQSLDDNCSPACCTGKRLVLNFIIPSFCGSFCIEPRPNVCYPFGPNVADWLIYRYELLTAKKKLAEIIAKTEEERVTLRECWLQNGGIDTDLGEFIGERREFASNCLNEWKDILFSPLEPVQSK
eukprot:TRINITY_DN55_c0_g1_i1.p1 TRINITY_DN55_c0_g1~~TRINITY_DN55_c0_g1_i1.p1  ORF type:complete len:291 (-),score=39.95 TRINITY_DN55_c0_g1_i1:352-1224(-)